MKQVINTSSRERILRIGATYCSLFLPLLKSDRKRLFVANVMGGVGLLSQLGGVAILFYYAKRLVSGNEILIGTYIFHPKESLQLSIVASLVVLIAFLLSSYLNYLYQKLMIQVSSDGEKTLLVNFHQFLEKSDSVRIPQVSGFANESTIIKIALGDTRSCARAYMMAVSSVMPAIILLGSLVTLLYINWIISLAIIPLSMLFFLAVYRVNIMGVASSKALEHDIISVRDLFRDTVMSSSVSPNREFQERVGAENRVQIAKYVDSYRNLISLPSKSNFVTDLFLAMTIATVLLGLSVSSILSLSTWGNVITYLVALRYGVSALKQLSAKLTVMNRFYPQVCRYITLIKSLAEGTRQESSVGEVSLKGNVQFSFTDTTMQLSKGRPTVLFCKKNINRFNVELFIDSLISAAKRSMLSRVFIVADVEAPKGSSYFTNRNFSLELATDRSSIARCLTILDDSRAIVSELQQSNREQLSSRRTSLILSLLPLFERDFDWIFISAAKLELLSNTEKNKLFALFPKAFILITSKELVWSKDSYSHEQQAIVMSNDQKVIWVGPFAQYFIDLPRIKLDFKITENNAAFVDVDTSDDLAIFDEV